MTIYTDFLIRAVEEYLISHERPLDRTRPPVREWVIMELENRPGLILIGCVVFWLLVSLLLVLGSSPYYFGGV